MGTAAAAAAAAATAVVDMGFGTDDRSSSPFNRAPATSVSSSKLLARSFLAADFLGFLEAVVPEAAFLFPPAVFVVFNAPSTPARADADSSKEVLVLASSAALRLLLGGILPMLSFIKYTGRTLRLPQEEKKTARNSNLHNLCLSESLSNTKRMKAGFATRLSVVFHNSIVNGRLVYCNYSSPTNREQMLIIAAAFTVFEKPPPPSTVVELGNRGDEPPIMGVPPMLLLVISAPVFREAPPRTPYNRSILVELQRKLEEF